MEQSNLSLNHLCPSCGAENFVKHLELEDYFLTKEEFTIIKCINCGLMSTYPKPAETELGRYYESNEYISHNTGNKGLIYYVYDLFRRRTLASKINLINKYSKGKSLLDIGCATGVFINYCQKHSYQVEGIEPDLKAREYSIQHYGLKVNDTPYLNQCRSNSFDIVTMWHVLEHVSDLNERLSVIRKILKDTGTLFIALPNPSSFDAQYYGKYWAAYDVPRHLFHFTQESFTTLITHNGFKVIKVIPMVFDSFYISMLSEKYKYGNISYLKAFLMGLRSNFYAKRHNTNYSSLIYILKKV